MPATSRVAFAYLELVPNRGFSPGFGCAQHEILTSRAGLRGVAAQDDAGGDVLL